MVSTTCPSCGNGLEIDNKYVGKNVLCPFCQNLFVPPYPQSGLGVTACFLAVLSALIEVLAIVYFVAAANLETGFLSAPALKSGMALLRFFGLLLSWIGIACAGFALGQKKRRKGAAKWGLMLNIILTVFVCGYFLVASFIPKREPRRQPDNEQPSSGAPRESSAWGMAAPEVGRLRGRASANLPQTRTDNIDKKRITPGFLAYSWGTRTDSGL